MTTFFITTVRQATVMIALTGISWAIAMWVPFALLMEFLREIDADNDASDRALTSGRPSDASITSPIGTRTRSSRAASPADEHRRLLADRPSVRRLYSASEVEAAVIENTQQGPVAGGTIMGIHNLAIVFPQFLVSGVM